MKTFTDSDGREWTLRLTLGAEQRIHAATEVWLSDISLDNLGPLERLDKDGGFLLAVLWEASVKDCKQALKKEQLAEALDSATRPAAVEAITEEVLDFLGGRGGQMRGFIAAYETQVTKGLEEQIALLQSRGNSIAKPGEPPASPESTR